jgi:Na+/H+-dicarboxylate symporter
MSEAKAGSGKLQLHWKMLIGFLAGLALGLVAHYGAGSDAGWVQWLTTYVTQPAGTLFLRLIFMLVIPLLFSALIIGVAEMGDVRSLGRVGWKTLGYTVIASGIAVALGLLLVNWLQPGAGVDPAAGAGDAGAGRGPREGHRGQHALRSPGAWTCCWRSCRTTWSRPRPRTPSWR